MPLLVIIGVVLWFVFGDPPKNIANIFWEYEAAPWESVDAFYYPDRSDLTEYEVAYDLQSVEECQTWVYRMSARFNDPGLRRGDYECAIGEVESSFGFTVYRVTTN